MTDLLDKLNPEQIKAVQATEGPVLILAGAGSGKTKTLTSRVAYLVQTKKATPSEILAVTFTNKAAGEMKQRIMHLLKLKSDKAFHISTFHSLCSRILRADIQHIGRNQNFTILDTDEQTTAVKQAMNDLNVDTQKFAPGAVLNYISSAKSELINAEEYPEMAYGYFQKVVAKVYPRYQEIILANNSLDFDDLLMQTVVLFRNNPDVLKKYQTKFKYIMVDEYQDTNTAQYQLTKLLAEKHKNLFVVGDDWQSIYSWRGANYRNILNFHKDYPKAKTIKLEENYRSTQNLLNSAAAVISANKNRSEKELWTKNGEGEPITIKQVFNEEMEGKYIIQEILQRKSADPKLDFNDFVILYRTNAQSRALEEAFLQQNIPYRIIGGTRFYDRKEIKDVLAFMKVINNPQDDLSLKRIINLPPRGVGEKTWEELVKYATVHNQPTSEILLDVPVGAKAQAELRKLGQVFTEARSGKRVLSKLFDYLLEKTGYLVWLNDKTIEGETRIENVRELKSVIEKYDILDIKIALPLFLEEVSLIQDIDRYDADENAVSLMTLHSAKGLEFDYVFIAGMEENLFPHSRSILDEEELEEERRLCYVGMTRAKKKLYLIYTVQRLIFGTFTPSLPSRFIDDIPEELKVDGNEMSHTTTTIEEVSPALKVKPGDWIEHKHFGPGKVITVDKLEVIAAFQQFGIKRLARNLAPIKKIVAPTSASL
ncbi:MAG: UvrD-helicase domain-containing protein [Patescibacteria group bacterium]